MRERGHVSRFCYCTEQYCGGLGGLTMCCGVMTIGSGGRDYDEVILSVWCHGGGQAIDGLQSGVQGVVACG